LSRYRWRIMAAISGALLAVPLLAWHAGPVTASGTGTFIWTGTLWRDPLCGTSYQRFNVLLYRHTYYKGTTWRVCSDRPDFCSIPYGYDSADAITCRLGIAANDTLNDKVSSLHVVWVGGADSCRVRLHEHANYRGGAMTYWGAAWAPTLVPWPTDKLSSVRRVC
jgi:hypothetical protein